MKKNFFFLYCFFISIVLSAQTKVAILETVDRTESVNYGVKLLVRSSLTTAISSTAGYEGYDRVDMATIEGEQSFQRTGNVSDDQIKRIGVACGASYVLVAEVAQYDAASIIITAKLLDVETFLVKNSAVQIADVSPDGMMESCNELSAKLLGLSYVNSKIKAESTKETPNSAPSSSSNEKKFLTQLEDGTTIYVASADEPDPLNHNEAINACACKGTGWRLPTKDELRIIRDKRDEIGGISFWSGYWSIESGKRMLMDTGIFLPTLNVIKFRARCVKEVK